MKKIGEILGDIHLKQSWPKILLCTLKEIAPDVFRLKVSIANVYFIGPPPRTVDIGGYGNTGARGTDPRSGGIAVWRDARPEAILLTHGHMDHAGSALDLANFWDVSVFAHPLELPYLTGRSKYPPLDPTVGGFMALLGRFVSVPSNESGGETRPKRLRSRPY